MATAAKGNGTVKVLGILVVIAGVILVVAGAITWAAVASNLAKEDITVSPDAAHFAGQQVDTPWEAWAQADIINHHALTASNGLTYAQLGSAITAQQNTLKAQGKTPEEIAADPSVTTLQSQRSTVMTASFLRSSLFTSVIAFGVAVFAFGVGIISLLVGWALLNLSRPAKVAMTTPEPNTADTADTTAV
jgi:hypothetical protein